MGSVNKPMEVVIPAIIVSIKTLRTRGVVYTGLAL